MLILDVVATLESLCDVCSEYVDNLPTFESDTRTAALITWCLAYKCRDYDTLPIYWHKSVGTLLLGLRLCRVGSMYKERSEEVTKFCIALLEYLWGKHSRHYVALHSRGCWSHCRIDFQQYYDALWTVWRNVVKRSDS